MNAILLWDFYVLTMQLHFCYEHSYVYPQGNVGKTSITVEDWWSWRKFPLPKKLISEKARDATTPLSIEQGFQWLAKWTGYCFHQFISSLIFFSPICH